MTTCSPVRPAALTPREFQVINQYAWGFTNKEIAQQLTVSVKTVEAHKSNGMRKLGYTSRAQVVRHGVRERWLTPDDTVIDVPASSPSQ
jgi:DNA-binding NarL/FixJ family response regulator